MTNHKPAIPAKVRDVAYFALLIGAALALATSGLSAIWLDETVAQRVSESADVLLAVLALVGGGLGVAYRPGKQTRQTGAQHRQEGQGR